MSVRACIRVRMREVVKCALEIVVAGYLPGRECCDPGEGLGTQNLYITVYVSLSLQ